MSAKTRKRKIPAMPAVQYAPPRVCQYCDRTGTVLDAERTLELGTATAVYLCEAHFRELYPELIPPLPEPPDLPVFGGQYLGGLYSKPNPKKARKRWRAS